MTTPILPGGSMGASEIPLGRALRRAVRRRCPACGHGPLFDGWFTPHVVCGGCGLRPDRGEADYFLGALLVNFSLTELAIAAVVLGVVAVTWPATPWRVVAVAGVVAAIAVPIVAYPIARMVWLAVDLQFRPPIRAGDPAPPFEIS